MKKILQTYKVFLINPSAFYRKTFTILPYRSSLLRILMISIFSCVVFFAASFFYFVMLITFNGKFGLPDTPAIALSEFIFVVSWFISIVIGSGLGFLLVFTNLYARQLKDRSFQVATTLLAYFAAFSVILAIVLSYSDNVLTLFAFVLIIVAVFLHLFILHREVLKFEGTYAIARTVLFGILFVIVSLAISVMISLGIGVLVSLVVFSLI